METLQPEATPHAGRDLTRIQIYKHVTKERLLDIGDMMTLEARRSKISLTLVEFEEGYKATTRVRHYVDAADMKLACWDILTGGFTEWSDHKGTTVDGQVQARVLTLRRDPKYRQPFVIKIDNGVGETLPGGAVKMLQTTESLTLLMSDWDARRMAQTVLDYIRDWEVMNFRKRVEAQTVLIPVGDTGSESDTDAPRRQKYARAA